MPKIKLTCIASQSSSSPSFSLSLSIFQDDKLQYVNTLQPKYSSIDVSEVELPESDANTMANSDMERERMDENTNMLLDVRIS